MSKDKKDIEILEATVQAQRADAVKLVEALEATVAAQGPDAEAVRNVTETVQRVTDEQRAIFCAAMLQELEDRVQDEVQRRFGLTGTVTLDPETLQVRATPATFDSVHLHGTVEFDEFTVDVRLLGYTHLPYVHSATFEVDGEMAWNAEMLLEALKAKAVTA